MRSRKKDVKEMRKTLLKRDAVVVFMIGWRCLEHLCSKSARRPIVVVAWVDGCGGTHAPSECVWREAGTLCWFLMVAWCAAVGALAHVCV